MIKIQNRINKSKKPVLILICGMPGTRKSSTAIQLASKLDWQITIGTDEIREVMRKYDKEPFLQGTSHDRWKLLGEKTDKNFLLGVFKHCQIIKKGILAIIEKSERNGENLIIEGVHLLPNLYKDFGSFNKFHFIFIVKSFSQHQKNIKNKILRRHNIQKDEWTIKEKDLLKLQEYIIQQTKQSKNVYILESTTPQENSQKIINILEKEL